VGSGRVSYLSGEECGAEGSTSSFGTPRLDDMLPSLTTLKTDIDTQEKNAFFKEIVD
jgi:hypothetical protein